jgi:hypothetical protein
MDTILKGDHLRIISAKFRKCPNLNCISIIMSFLTYITGFFMNFELLPILTDYDGHKFERDPPRDHHATFGLIWFSGFRG